MANFRGDFKNNKIANESSHSRDMTRYYKELKSELIISKPNVQSVLLIFCIILMAHRLKILNASLATCQQKSNKILFDTNFDKIHTYFKE